jgi:hypothetical protein
VEAATVSDAAAAGNQNVLQASNTPDANSSDPDLVSAAFFANGDNPDQVVYTFDEPVNATGGITVRPSPLQHAGAAVAGTAAAVTQGATSSQLVVTFANIGTPEPRRTRSVPRCCGAVTSTTGGARTNDEDEVGVANTATTTVAAGRTTRPDLTGVALSTTTGATGTQAWRRTRSTRT